MFLGIFDQAIILLITNRLFDRALYIFELIIAVTVDLLLTVVSMAIYFPDISVIIESDQLFQLVDFRLIAVFIEMEERAVVSISAVFILLTFDSLVNQRMIIIFDQVLTFIVFLNLPMILLQPRI